MGPTDKHRQEDFVQHLFDKIARRYDVLNSILTLNQDSYWRSFAAEKATIKAGDSVLDVCCGTGKLSLALAERAGFQGHVTGLDFSQDMLRQAKEHIKNTPYAKTISFLAANALHLPFTNSAFDCAAIGFGLRNVSDIRGVLAEMYRVIKPGGTIVAAELSKPSLPILKQLYYLYFNHLLPLIGNLWSNNDHPYYNLPASLKTLPDSPAIHALLLDTGLRQVTTYQLTGGIAAVYVGIK